MSMPQQSQTTSRTTWTNASTRSVDVFGTKFVYRQLGAENGVPVIFLNHLAAELDRWDPRVVDGIASRRRVIAFDNRGVGASEGWTPNSVAAMAQDCLNRVIPFGERHLRRTLAEFVDHYHRERNHRGLGNELIDGVRQERTVGGIRRRQRLGGLLNYYYRAA